MFSAVGLLFVGAVLFLNALVSLGRVDARSAAPFNLFVGALQVVIPFYLIANAESADDVLLTSAVFAFGFTYLYVGITTLADLKPLGLGWFCLWVVIVAVTFAVVNLIKFGDVNSAVQWLNWAFLWGLFWMILALGRERLGVFTGWVTLIMSFTTCTIPALLILLGLWDSVPPEAGAGVGVASVLAFAAIARRTLRSAPEVGAGGAGRTPGLAAR